MFVKYTFSDWEASPDKRALLKDIISSYKTSADFKTAKSAQRYYESDNEKILEKVILQADAITVKDENGREKVAYTNRTIEGNRIRGNFFQRLVDQQASYLLGNGVSLGKEEEKDALGLGFDMNLAQIGQDALVHGVCWGFWNYDHVECIPAYTDALSGAVALLDERTSAPRVLIQFWQIDANRKMHVRVFTEEKIYNFTENDDNDLIPEKDMPEEAYITVKAIDGAGAAVIGQNGYGKLPIVPFWANKEHRSELTLAIKSKIDLHDRIFSDFGDNLDMANDVYWVLNNFGGNSNEALQMMKQIHELKAIINISDGVSAGSTAEPHSFEVPYEARQIALDLLKKSIFDDFMGLDMSSLTGGYLTNIAIKAAMTSMDLKANKFEWQAFNFVQQILSLIGIKTERIRFKRAGLINEQEMIQNIYQMREDIDQKTALKLNPMIDQEDVDDIIKASEAEKAGMGDEEPEEREILTGPEDEYQAERETRRESGVIFR